jgi:hypothetical protein
MHVPRELVIPFQILSCSLINGPLAEESETNLINEAKFLLEKK